jgi:predicted Zn-dependent peptidase
MTLAALLLVISAARPAPAPAAPVALGTRQARPDGMELVVLPVEAARTVSLRYVVRAGSSNDPAGKEGLAHVLEHAVFQARGPDGLDLLEATRAAGAHLNAHTSRTSTIFELDAAAEVFAPLAERLVRAVTDPALQRVDLDRELETILREDAYQGNDQAVMQLVEDTILRGSAPATILGSSPSRERIRRQDLIAFYRTFYATSNTTVVVAGEVDAAAAEALLDRSVRLPPALASERPPPAPTATPTVPIEDRIRAPFLAVVFGYVLESQDRESCEPLAELLERRLLGTLVAGPRRPSLRDVEVSCVDVQGSTSILALGYTRTLDAPDLHQSIQRVFDLTARAPASRAEQKALETRGARRREHIQRDPAALADEVAQAAVHPLRAGATPLPARTEPSFPAERVLRTATQAFVPERRFLVLFSPFAE